MLIIKLIKYLLVVVAMNLVSAKAFVRIDLAPAERPATHHTK